jgi:hypothetical protein
MSIPIPTALLRAMQKVYGDNWDRHEVFADIMQCMEATFDRTADGEKTIRAAIDCFIELWIGQQEWDRLEDHLEDDDYDYEVDEIESIGKLMEAWRAELSADIMAQPTGTELTPDELAVLGGDHSSTRLQ